MPHSNARQACLVPPSAFTSTAQNAVTTAIFNSAENNITPTTASVATKKEPCVEPPIDKHRGTQEKRRRGSAVRLLRHLQQSVTGGSR
jgi:hypothetical protein